MIHRSYERPPNCGRNDGSPGSGCLPIFALSSGNRCEAQQKHRPGRGSLGGVLVRPVLCWYFELGMSELDVAKEQIAYLKFWLGAMVVTDISLFGWLISNANSTSLRLLVGGCLAVIAITAASRYCIAGLNDRSKICEGCSHGDGHRDSSGCCVACVPGCRAGCDKVSEVSGVGRRTRRSSRPA